MQTLRKDRLLKKYTRSLKQGSLVRLLLLRILTVPEFQKAIKEADALSDFVQEAIDTDGIIRFTDMTPDQTSLLKDMLSRICHKGWRHL